MNREIYPAVLYPLIGDVESQAGNSGVTVVGLQNITVSNAFPENGASLVYLSATHNWTPTILDSTIQVNSVPVSDDPWISVNVVKPITINGS